MKKKKKATSCVYASVCMYMCREEGREEGGREEGGGKSRWEWKMGYQQGKTEQQYRCVGVCECHIAEASVTTTLKVHSTCELS